MKDLTAALKVVQTQDKVELILETQFDTDQDLLKFQIQFTKICNQFRYVKWLIKGKFTDEGQSKAIGQMVAKLTKAYRIELNLSDTYFADVGAKQLADSFKSLPNLRIFKLIITYPLYRMAKNLTQKGIDQMQVSLNNMKNLEIFESNLAYEGLVGPKYSISNYIYNSRQNFKYFYTQQVINPWDFLYQNFLEEISKQANRITSVQFLKYGLNDAQKKESYHFEQDELASDENLNFILKQIKYVYDLQYITKYQHTFQEQEILSLRPQCLIPRIISSYNNFLIKLASQRYAQIQQIVLFNQFIKPQLNINSVMVLADLLFD